MSLSSHWIADWQTILRCFILTHFYVIRVASQQLSFWDVLLVFPLDVSTEQDGRVNALLLCDVLRKEMVILGWVASRTTVVLVKARALSQTASQFRNRMEEMFNSNTSRVKRHSSISFYIAMASHYFSSPSR
jgi:hypothetical protein